MSAPCVSVLLPVAALRWPITQRDSRLGAWQGVPEKAIPMQPVVGPAAKPHASKEGYA
jgi:hypothetical protein